MRTGLRLTLSSSLAFGALGYLGSFTAVPEADAQGLRRPHVARRGGQWGAMLGGSACIPGRASCSRDGVSEGGVTISGDTQPSFGANAELGYRLRPWLFLGASYNLGFFNTQYEVEGSSGYRRAFQNSIYGVVRPSLPLWRFDLGLTLGPGFSRQVFVLSNDDRDYSQGFSGVVGPAIDVWVSRRMFVGAKLDLLFNAHRRTCRQRGNSTTCNDTQDRDVAPVHQMIFGLHIGGTFL